jgi:hypothetical protein
MPTGVKSHCECVSQLQPFWTDIAQTVASSTSVLAETPVDFKVLMLQQSMSCCKLCLTQQQHSRNVQLLLGLYLPLGLSPAHNDCRLMLLLPLLLLLCC